MAEVRRARRYYLLRRLYFSRVECDDDMAGVWRAKQEAEPGTALAADFPYRALLVGAGYSTVEDIDGADSDELAEIEGLSASHAITILAALPSL